MIVTTYRLACGHLADVPGPAGATTGRAWCDWCGESAAVAHELPRGPAEAERCSADGSHAGSTVNLPTGRLCNRHAVEAGAI